MAISANYPQPVYVNGYACIDCAEVAEAKRDIDPAHPRSGPGGTNAQFDPTVRDSPAVIFGGVLARMASSQTPADQTSPVPAFALAGASSARSDPRGLGGLLDISA